VLSMTTSAGAMEVYCQSTPTRVHNGGHYESQWTIVHPKARRTQLPGQSKPSTTCSVSYSSVGAMYRPIEIIKAPRNGQARVVHTYSVYYTPAKMGPDELTIKIYWVGQQGGDLRAATVRYSIQVVDRPL